MFLNILLFFFTMFILLYIKLKYFKSRKEKMLLSVPGPDYNLFFGNSLRFSVKREDLHKALWDVSMEFRDSPLMRIWLLTNVKVFLNKPESAEVIMKNSREISKGYAYRFLIPWFNDGLIASGGAKWMQRRRLITPAFHYKILEQYHEISNEQACILTKLLGEKKGYFNVYPCLSNCTLDILCESAMGVKLQCQQEKGKEYLTAVNGACKTIIQRVFNLHLQIDWLFPFTSTGREQKEHIQIIKAFTKKVIKDRKIEHSLKTIKPKEKDFYRKKSRLAFLDLLLEAQKNENAIDDEGIQEEVDMFMFAGHDTTANATTWAIYNIARFQDIQKKIQEELDRVLGEEEITDITVEQLKELKYLDCVLKESMRICPTAPLYSRKLIKDTEICGHVLPAGVGITFNVEQIHLDPAHWPDPEKFDPERFLPENAAGRHPFAFIPFSAGPRNCIGQRFAMMELKTILAHVFHKYTIATNVVFDRNKVLCEFTYRPADGIWIKVENRHQL